MDLTHTDKDGRSRMVDISAKPITTRKAVATGFVRMSGQTVESIRLHQTPKGNPLETARLAGVMAAKKTAELIPLCHPLPLNQITVDVELLADGVSITASAITDARTGVEMEALTAVSIAALTVYDMCKAIDKSMTLTDIRLESKSGGTSGDYIRGGEGLG